ncbi:MAG: hypothetical protein A2038_09080 [Deltaproteobacteria bacterium GWA2_57_13]|nr:MAG: hypothetical protein A2038_09080 [Deltaproteobacteria bacterium GWA2_57_13]
MLGKPTRLQSCSAFLGLVLLGSIQGCAAIGLTLFGVGAGVTTGTAVAYSLDGYAYRNVRGR